METGFLNFHDEEHFSDFSLPLEQVMLLMHIVENDFDYMETHLDIVNSDSIWSNEHECTEDVEEDIPTISKMDNIKEDFAKVLTDWQEHIGYLQTTDIDEYMDIIGLNTNNTDRKSICSSESIFEDEQAMQTLEPECFKAKQVDLTREYLQNDKEKHEPSSSNKNTENLVEQNSYHKIADAIKSCDKQEHTQDYLCPKSSQSKIKKNIPNMLAKQKKRKREKTVISNKDTKISNCNSKSHTNQLAVLEAGTVESLLEKFEASENSVVSSDSSSKSNTDFNREPSLSCYKKQHLIKEPRSTISKKSLSQVSNLHKNIRNALSNKVIEKIKTSGRKKLISIVPTMPSIQGNSRSNGTRMQDAAVTLSRNKLLKIVTNNTKTRAIDGGLVQLDHDYCSNTTSSVSSSDSNSEYEKQSSDSEKTTPVKDCDRKQTKCHDMVTKSTIALNENKILIKKKGHSVESNAKKSCTLKLNKISCDRVEQIGTAVCNSVQVSKCMKQHIEDESQQETVTGKERSQCVNISNKTINSVNQFRHESSSNSTPEMKIRSALATSILQLQRGGSTKTKCTNGEIHKTKQMISVLKKPLNGQLPSVVISNACENVVATNNSSNDRQQSIIIQNTDEKLIPEEQKKPPRKKLNLAEYRSRREQNRSDNSGTNSPIQPMTLIYIHHVSTTTEPIKDDFGSLNWSEREIVSILKPKGDVDEEKVRPKPKTCDVGIQTYETVFEFPPKSLIDVDDRNEEEREKQVVNRSQRSYRLHRISSSTSRSRSRSKSKSRSKSRSRSSSSRSRSCKRSITRHRRISHRRSSVSSSSSWSSRSRSNTTSTFSSGSTYSRSHSRSSRSRSQCSSPYSSCSRSSTRSNFGRNKWSNRRRKERRHRKCYERHRQRSTNSYSYRDCEYERRRSPSSSYHKAYDSWASYDREKQRQVEERRVIYVGQLEEGITKTDLRRRFERFGPVVDISVHFREHGDNYGFVTFAFKHHAYEAVEHGNDDPDLPRYDLCFGGRRAFCKVKYADLDGVASGSPGSSHLPPMNEDNTFDLLLKEAKAKLRKRKV
nr:NK-tumor recognition protein [Megalopta genalis]